MAPSNGPGRKRPHTTQHELILQTPDVLSGQDESRFVPLKVFTSSMAERQSLEVLADRSE